MHNSTTTPPDWDDTDKKSGQLPEIKEKLHHYFDKNALTKLAMELDVPPEKQQEVLRSYVKKIVEDILPHVKCPDHGALLNLDYPDNVIELEIQIQYLMKEIVDLSREEFDLYKDLIGRLRRDIVRMVEGELESKGVERKVAAKGEHYGEGGIGTIHACRVGDKNLAMKRLQDHLRDSDKHDEDRFTYYTYPELVEATKASENLVTFYGPLLLEDEDGVDRIDFYEELEGTKGLDEYLDHAYEKDKNITLHQFFSNIFIPILKGVKALHDRGLTHLDLKEANFFVCPPFGKISGPENVKVGDYDLVRRSGYQPKGTNVQGSPSHMSPEQWNGGVLTEKSDIYSLGLIFYYLLGGHRIRGDWTELFKRSRQGVDLSDFEAPPSIKTLIEKCLKKDSEERPDIDELISSIQTLSADLTENMVLVPGASTGYSGERFKFTYVEPTIIEEEKAA